VWFRTPLDYISRSQRKFHIDTHWSYYTQLTHIIHLPLFSRQIKTTPWDRFPSDLWLPAEGWVIIFGLIVQIPFSFSFLIAWFFYFPSATEQLLWRVCSVYHAAFSLFGTAYYMFGTHDGQTHPVVTLWRKMSEPIRAKRPHRVPTPEAVALQVEEVPAKDSGDRVIQVARVEGKNRLPKAIARLQVWLGKWRNISPDQDPDMEVPLRWIVPIFFACFFYILCRLYFYVEDFVSLRAQPVGAYQSVNRFIPFI
jgi:hypothetical protein